MIYGSVGFLAVIIKTMWGPEPQRRQIKEGRSQEFLGFSTSYLIHTATESMAFRGQPSGLKLNHFLTMNSCTQRYIRRSW